MRLVLLFALVLAAAHAATYFASSTGAGDTCLSMAPCNFTTALAASRDSDKISLLSTGIYGDEDCAQDVPQSNLIIEAWPVSGARAIFNCSNSGLRLRGNSSTIDRLHFVYSGTDKPQATAIRFLGTVSSTTIKHSKFQYWPYAIRPGNMELDMALTLSISDNEFVDCLTGVSLHKVRTSSLSRNNFTHARLASSTRAAIFATSSGGDNTVSFNNFKGLRNSFGPAAIELRGVDAGRRFTISNSHFADLSNLNDTVNGGAIGISGIAMESTISIKDCTFSNIVTARSGGAVAVEESPHATENFLIQRCNFEDCEGSHGGAIYYSGVNTTVLNLQESTFDSCLSSSEGGAVWIGAQSPLLSRVSVSECLFSECIARDLGGAIFAADVRVSSTDFYKCSAGSRGGVLYQHDEEKEGTVLEFQQVGIINCSVGPGGRLLEADCITDPSNVQWRLNTVSVDCSGPDYNVACSQQTISTTDVTGVSVDCTSTCASNCTGTSCLLDPSNNLCTGNSSRYYPGPTIAPTLAPTLPPTSPTSTLVPTATPTVLTTIVTSATTVMTTLSPTTFPSIAPSVAPSVAPSIAPSIVPTLQPTSIVPPGTVAPVISGNVTLSSNSTASAPVSVSSGVTVIVNGTLSLVSQLTLGEASVIETSQGSRVVLGGDLVLQLPSKPTPGQTLSIPVVLGQGSVSESFSSINATSLDLEPCEMLLTMPSSSVSAGVLFSVDVSVDSSGCGLPIGAIVGIAVGALLLGVATAVIVALVHRRQKAVTTANLTAKVNERAMQDAIKMRDDLGTQRL